MIDTLQLGEIPGKHHGTYQQGQWWWNARGYTPAGVEAWFGIRALDPLSVLQVPDLPQARARAAQRVELQVDGERV